MGLGGPNLVGGLGDTHHVADRVGRDNLFRVRARGRGRATVTARVRARVGARVRVRVRIESVEVTVEMPRREAIREARVDLPQPEVPPGEG